MQRELEPINSYDVELLVKDLAKRHISKLTDLANLIPQVHYVPEEILSEKKGERMLHNKWDHSLVVLNNDQPIAFITGYERESENNDQYPENTLYINELVVDTDYQKRGIARKLLSRFLEYNQRQRFKTLSGKLNFSVQTNSADWNIYVCKLYENFGFKERAKKKYEKSDQGEARVDVIMRYKPSI